MYDFYFGAKQEIEKDPKKYLLAIKRLLPRWCNSIPDSEYLALYDVLAESGLPERPVLVETGSGASTIVLCYFALLRNGELYTWDINGSKLYYLRSVINDTLMRFFTEKNLVNHWKYVAYNSNSEDAGINILAEMKKSVNACFLDSEHTLDVLMKELGSVSDLLDSGAIVAIDDGNYSYKHKNIAYLNMIRTKNGLSTIGESPDNIGRCFWEEVEDHLKKKFSKIDHLQDNYKKYYQNDIFWDYYKLEREATVKLAMEKPENLDHRFDAWKVWK